MWAFLRVLSISSKFYIYITVIKQLDKVIAIIFIA